MTTTGNPGGDGCCFALTVADAIRFTGLNRTALYRLMAEGRLAPRKIGRRTLLLASELRELIEKAPPAKVRKP